MLNLDPIIKAGKCNMCDREFKSDEDLELLSEATDPHLGCPDCRTDAYLMDQPVPADYGWRLSDLSHTADWAVEARFSPDVPGVWLLDNEDDTWAVQTRWTNPNGYDGHTVLHYGSFGDLRKATEKALAVSAAMPERIFCWDGSYLEVDFQMNYNKKGAHGDQKVE